MASDAHVESKDTLALATRYHASALAGGHWFERLQAGVYAGNIAAHLAPPQVANTTDLARCDPTLI
jgi:hypothetical protein